MVNYTMFKIVYTFPSYFLKIHHFDANIYTTLTTSSIIIQIFSKSMVVSHL